jgi:hypothetical protein
VDVYVYGKNLGGASDFSIVCAVLEIRELPGEAWDNWPEVDSKRTLISDVKSGQEFTATVSFPTTDEFQFEHGKVYYIETFVAKKQNYLQFRDGPWQFSDDIWRLGSFGTWELVIP